MYAGGCAMNSDSIYWFGGFSGDDTGDISLKSVYRLKINDTITLNDKDEADWNLIGYFNSNGIADKLSATAISTDPSKILVAGGNVNDGKETNFRIYDTTTKTFEIGTSKLVDKYNYNGNKTLDAFSPINGTLVSYGDELIYVGGFTLFNSLEILDRTTLIRYNYKSKEVTITDDLKTALDRPGACVYKDKLYIFGGYLYDKKKMQAMKTIIIYDFKNGGFGEKTATGDIPEDVVYPSSTIVGNIMYMLGGSTDNEQYETTGSFLYTLNMDTFVWNKINIENFEPAYYGCLVHYQGYLILSFGTYQHKKKSKTQLIDLKQNKLVRSLSLNDTQQPRNITTDKNSGSTENNLGAIIGGCVAAILFIVGVVGACIFFRRRRNRKSKENHLQVGSFMYPQPLSEPIWANPTEQPTNDKLFSLESTGFSHSDQGTTLTGCYLNK